MSLLTSIEKTIKSHRDEQAKLIHSIQLYKDILQSLTQESDAIQETESAHVAVAESTSGEKEDMELIEFLLQKAVRVRTGTEPSENHKLSVTQEEKSPTLASSLSWAGTNKAQRKPETTTKSASNDQKVLKMSGVVGCPMLGSRPSVQCKPARPKTIHRKMIPNYPSSCPMHHKIAPKHPVSVIPYQLKASTLNNKAIGTSLASHCYLGKGASGTMESGRLPPDQSAKWKYLRRKQNRLWQNVLTSQKTPVAERSHFMERMRATFPKEWPCGSPDETRMLLSRLTDRGLNLDQRCEAEEVLVRQMARTELDGEVSESHHTLKRHQWSAAELQSCAGRGKQEWKAWDRWRPEGGCLCLSGAIDVLGEGGASPLPLTITYTTEAELQQVEGLRMRVALLQQELYLEQAVLDALSPQFSSILPGPGCPKASVLRDLYSLLGEGGERFPAIILDSEQE